MRTRLVPAALLSLTLATLGLAQPVITGVVDGASFSPIAAPGGLISIFGLQLADRTASASGIPLPGSLGGTTVKVSGSAIPLYFVSPGQINAQLPFTLSPSYEFPSSTTCGGSSPPCPPNNSITVTTSAGTSSAQPFQTTASGPAIFTRTANGQGDALIFRPDFTLAGSLSAGGTYIIYAAGLGAVSPAALPGYGGAGAEPLNRAVSVPDLLVGERTIPVDFAGLAPGFAGVYQINFTLPADFAPASDRLFLRSKYWQSNVTRFSFATPSDLSQFQIQSSITPVYPYASAATISFGPMLEVGTYSIRVSPRGSQFGPLVIAAVSDAGSAVVTVGRSGSSPSCSATLSATPSAGSRFYDFTGTALTAWDFAPVFAGNFGSPMPGNVVPLSRVDPKAINAVGQIPAMQAVFNARPNGSVTLTCDPGQSDFVVDNVTNRPVAIFGGFRPLIAGWVPTGTSSFRLYVNGTLVNSADVQWQALTRK